MWRRHSLKDLGYTFTFFCTGNTNGAPVLLIHGSGPGSSAATTWEFLSRYLSSDFFLIMPDLAGYGESDLPMNAPVSGIINWIDIWREQLIYCLDFLGIESCFVIGYSLGGRVGLELCIKHPNRVKKSVLGGTMGGPFNLTLGLEQIWQFHLNPLEEEMRKIIRVTTNISDKDIAELELRQRYASALRSLAKFRQIFGHVENFQDVINQTVISPSILSNIKNAILLIHGLQDRVIPPESSLYLANHIPNARVILVNQKGHAIFQTFAAVPLVRSFLKENSS